MLVLDTNTLSVLLRANPKYVARWEALPEVTPVFTTPITVFEILMKGRYQAVLAAAGREQLLTAYARLTADEVRLREFDLLPINADVADHFVRLLSSKKVGKIGRADLLIACICLAHDATLVTRNVKDFAHIPNLKHENWAG